jgi:hypothetical protein
MTFCAIANTGIHNDSTPIHSSFFITHPPFNLTLDSGLALGNVRQYIAPSISIRNAGDRGKSLSHNPTPSMSKSNSKSARHDPS